MVYQFSEWELDTLKHELRRLGEVVEIEPKGFDVLHYLLENHERMVSRDELLDACWPGRYLSESTLTTNMSRVRRIIESPHRNADPIIQTIRGRGYRLLVEVNEISENKLVEENPVPEVQQPAQEPAPAVAWQGVETRLLSVMSCALSEVDPDWEEQHLRMQTVQRLVHEAVEPMNGHVTRYNQQTVLAYFGYPQAHEDDARRAILSAVQLLSVLSQHQFEAMIGIHSGPVIIESSDNYGSGKTPTMTGEASLITTELGRLATPPGIIVSASAAQLAGDGIEWEALPEQTLPGLSEPLSAYRLLNNRAFTRQTPTLRRHLTPLVERNIEQALLLERWQRVRAGQGHSILLSGEAGIGKSRLVQTLREQIATDACHYLEGYCSPYQQNSSLAPVVMLLKALLQWQPEDNANPEHSLKTLETLLETYQLPLQPNVALLADLLSLDVSTYYPPPALEPRQRHRQLLELLLILILQQASEGPLLLVIEDLQWTDPSTLDWLQTLLSQLPTTPILLVLTARPEFTPNWSLSTSFTTMPLERFMPDQIGQMLARLTGGKVLPVALQQQIVEKTDGVPLFIEELLQSLLESNQLHETEQSFELSSELSALSVPATLQGLLMARLDRLGEAKQAAYWGAVIGREFSHRLLAAVTVWDENYLISQIEQLLNSGLVFQHGIGQQARYWFKHALVQEAAYGSMLKRQHQEMHRRVAEVLESRKASGEQIAPERLAQHHTAAGDLERAIPYWYQAGTHSATRSALTEAMAYFNQGLELLKQLPDRRDYQQQELNYLIALGSVRSMQGETSKDIETLYQRAHQLYSELGEPVDQIMVLWELCQYYLDVPALKTAQQLAEKMLSHARKTEETMHALLAHELLGTIMFVTGEFIIAREHLEQGIKLYDPERHHLLATRYGGYDPGIRCFTTLALVLASLGYPEQSVQRNREGLALAHRLSKPFALASTLDMSCRLYVTLRQENTIKTFTDELVELATQQNFDLMLNIGRIYQSTTLALQGESIDRHIKQIEQYPRSLITQKLQLTLPLWRYLYASVCISTGYFKQSLEAVNETLDHMDQMNVLNRWRADFLILKGRLCLHTSLEESAEPPEQIAERYFQQAYQLAEKQQAKLLQLRAATNLARLWQSQGYREEAYQLLFPVYDWFTEGFDTVDLKEAKALLDELA